MSSGKRDRAPSAVELLDDIELHNKTEPETGIETEVESESDAEAGTERDNSVEFHEHAKHSSIPFASVSFLNFLCSFFAFFHFICARIIWFLLRKF